VRYRAYGLLLEFPSSREVSHAERFIIVVRAEECRRQLEDTVNDEPDIEALRLTPNDWRQLSDIKKILAPFNEYSFLAKFSHISSSCGKR
jgi:hypothetical protein